MSLRAFFLGSVALFLVYAVAGVRSASAQEADHSVATEEESKLQDRYLWRINDAMSKLKNLQPQCSDCGLFTSGDEPPKSPSCRKTYKELYKIKDRIEQEPREPVEIDMRLMFGYMDVKREVDDHYARIAAIAQLTGPCEADMFACGFERDPDDWQLFRKTVKIMGPDGKLRKRIAKLRVQSSSMRDDERLNRGKYAELQEQRTAEMQALWEDGLQNADVLLYVGHAREGGGPDFGPPVINAKTKRTDFDWYRKNRPGARRMEETLRQSKKTPKILGMYACWAADHWGDMLRKAAPNSGLILSDQSEFEAIVSQSMATLDSALGMRCENEFKKAVNVIDKIETRVGERIENYLIKPVKFDGVFR